MGIKSWIKKKRLSFHPSCTVCSTMASSEQNIAGQRGRHLCTQAEGAKESVWAWANGRVHVRVHVCVNTAGHLQWRQASAAERDECCHSQVTPNPSQNDLLSSHFLSVPRLPFASQLHVAVQHAAELDWAWKHTGVQWPLDFFSVQWEEGAALSPSLFSKIILACIFEN